MKQSIPVEVVEVVPLVSTPEEREEFDAMFWSMVDPGKGPDEHDRHGDPVPKSKSETKLERMIRERKEQYDV